MSNGFQRNWSPPRSLWPQERTGEKKADRVQRQGTRQQEVKPERETAPEPLPAESRGLDPDPRPSVDVSANAQLLGCSCDQGLWEVS